MSLPGQLITPLLDDARLLASSGFASRTDIEIAMRLGAGHPKGPFEMMGESVPPSTEAVGDLGPAPANVAVLGTGTMATGIAEVMARSGIETVVVGRSVGRAESLIERVDARLLRAVERGRLSAGDRAAIILRLSPAADLSAAAPADLVVEAVAERLEVKRDLLAALESAAPGVPLATNTSSFRVADVSASVQARERVMALHFFNPAPAMRLVEVVGATDTDPELVRKGHRWARAMGKTTVSCDDQPGFLVNRLLIPYLNDAARTCGDSGIAWSDADASVRDELRHPMGPFELMDLIGLDVMVFALETMRAGLNEPRFEPSASLRELVARGRLGRKSSAGFHDYANGR